MVPPDRYQKLRISVNRKCTGIMMSFPVNPVDRKNANPDFYLIYIIIKRFKQVGKNLYGILGSLYIATQMHILQALLYYITTSV